MPTGTKVEKCFTGLKNKIGSGSAAAICQSQTGQSLATGKKLPSKKGGGGRKSYKKGGR